MDIAYLEETPAGWTQQVAATWQVVESPGEVRLSGTCPTCGHDSSTTIGNIHLVPGEPGGRKSIIGRVEPIVIVCDCQRTHPGRPPEVTGGCGRGGHFELDPEP